MAQNDIQIVIHGLSELDRLELEEFIDKTNLSVFPRETPTGSYGDPGTLDAVIQVTQIALPALSALLAAFLAARHRSYHFTDKIEITTPGGTIRRTVKITAHESSGINAELMKAAANLASNIGAPNTGGDAD